ncbi:LysR family transcriptional regulator [Lactobacillus sp. LC28-10]|uniref:LysR family transcriptional regulator n=1 Tax=Secundilactobacillus angelensis TaxID=2722706 RepID=A0ABX1KYW2_9LACO|nr:LysR family transcriptional regulator [Secundilactobacillus angelensis]MCH5462634.1 LysR family transcriptional regulator [Secundilactobacillus angelensis]NLR19126.1 LysR family transcriptional regulator [Secundilactobacillus angelensis]
MNYNLMPVKYFIDVVQTGGFISAAKRNYVSETAVSSAIRKLEDELGHKLLNRKAGQNSLTPVGELFYARAVGVINAYNEIWYHPDIHPEKLVRIHFLQGLAADAVEFVEQLPKSTHYSFDEELLDTSINRLIKGYYDILIGFQLAFANNDKVKIFPLKTINFDLIFNKEEVTQNKNNLKRLAQNSKLYLQNWQSTGISDIQTAMINAYAKDGWNYSETVNINSFAAACLNVNFKGGFAMVPENFHMPENCENIYRYTPAHLKQAFQVVIATESHAPQALLKLIVKSIT